MVLFTTLGLGLVAYANLQDGAEVRQELDRLGGTTRRLMLGQERDLSQHPREERDLLAQHHTAAAAAAAPTPGQLFASLPGTVVPPPPPPHPVQQQQQQQGAGGARRGPRRLVQPGTRALRLVGPTENSSVEGDQVRAGVDDENCAICVQLLQDRAVPPNEWESLLRLPCGGNHLYHESCIAQWHQTQAERHRRAHCPQCGPQFPFDLP